MIVLFYRRIYEDVIVLFCARQVLHEAGVKVGGPEEDLDRLGGGDDSETEGAFGLEVSSK